MGMKIAVIGGGAAGMTAAVAAAGEGAAVTLYEKNDRLGKKLLSTGNGKCNLGNRQLSADEYYGGSREWIGRRLEQFGTEDTIRFFRGLGLLLKDKNGYLYPACEQASAVLDVLRTEVRELGIEVRCRTSVTDVGRDKKSGRLFVETDKAGPGASPEKYTKVQPAMRREEYDRIILACGGAAAPKTGSDGSGFRLAARLGHTCVPAVPALVQLKCRESYCKALAGVRTEAAIHIWDGNRELARERGELQLTDYGISGIPVFQLSRTANYRLMKEGELTAEIDFFPDYTEEDYRKLVRQRELFAGERTVEEFFTGLLSKKLMTLFIRLAGLKTNTLFREAPGENVAEVYRLCREFKLHVTGSNGFDSAQVSAGGVELSEVTEGLGSRLVPGVFFAGEILDVDGRCGGYNLQWAWCSGYLAGRAAAGAV